MMIPATDSAIEASPSFLARGAFDTALLLATAAQTHTKVAQQVIARHDVKSLLR